MLKLIEQDISIKKDIIINNIMKSKGVYLLVSNPKVGKSMLALQLSCSVINGTPFLGNSETTETLETYTHMFKKILQMYQNYLTH